MIPAAASSRYAARFASVTRSSPASRRRSRDRADSDSVIVCMRTSGGILSEEDGLRKPGLIAISGAPETRGPRDWKCEVRGHTVGIANVTSRQQALLAFP